MIKKSITTRTTEAVAKWMIPTELKKENEREIKNPTEANLDFWFLQTRREQQQPMVSDKGG